MLTPVHEALAALCRMSAQQAAAFLDTIASTSQNDLVKTHWTVTYDRLGRDMISVADVSLVNPGDSLLQVWLRNAAAGVWIPEVQPWEISVVEFKPEQSISTAKLGLIDSKWTGEDIGRRYHYQLWGFVLHGGKVESFAFEKWAAYPGDA